jgi:hypothetical protein
MTAVLGHCSIIGILGSNKVQAQDRWWFGQHDLLGAMTRDNFRELDVREGLLHIRLDGRLQNLALLKKL